MSVERWKPATFKGRPTPYQVSSHGRIRHGKTQRIATLRVTRRGYIYWQWSEWCKATKRVRHHLITLGPTVARAFKRAPRPGEQIEHLDQDKANNHNSNLRWMTQSQNVKRSFKLTQRTRGQNRKLSFAMYDMVRRLWAKGQWSQVQIGRALGLHNGTVSKIVTGVTTGTFANGPREPEPNWSLLPGSNPDEFV